MISLLITSLVWALSFGLIGNYLTGLPAGFVSMIRMAGALLVFLPFVKRIPLCQALPLMGIGAVQFGGMYLCYIAAFHYIPSYQVVLFTAATPIYIVLIDSVKKGQLSVVHFIAAILAVAGGAGILWKGWNGSEGLLVGFLLVQLSNFCFAAGQMAYASLKRELTLRKEASVFAYAYMGALLVTLPSGLSSSLNWQSITFAQWSLLLYLGVIASGLCFFLWNHGAQKVAPVRLAVMNNLKIPLGTLASLTLFGEHTNLPMLLIGCLFMVASFIVTPLPVKK